MGNSISVVSENTTNDSRKRKADESEGALSLKKPKSENQYFLNTKKHYRIWFSKDKDVFLPQENQLRFIRMRVKNPNATLSLVYSSKVLSEKAKKELHHFCAVHNIQPVDFDTEIRNLIRGADERALYKLAKEEIKYANGAGGSLAAASDIVRTIIGVIEKCGNYSDFDVDVIFSDLPEKHAVLSPVIFPISIVKSGFMEDPMLNNDFVGVCYDAKTGKIDLNARSLIKKMQEIILNNYSNPSKAITSSPLLEGAPSEIMPYYETMIEELYQSDPFFTIFDLREKIKTLNSRMMLKAAFNLQREMFETVKARVNALDENAMKVFSDKFLGESNAISLRNKIIFKTNPKDWVELLLPNNIDDFDKLNDEETTTLHQIVLYFILPEHLRNDVRNILETDIHNMYNHSVIKMSGPIVPMKAIMSMYLLNPPRLIMPPPGSGLLFLLFNPPRLEDPDSWKEALKQFSKYSTQENQIAGNIKSANSCERIIETAERSEPRNLEQWKEQIGIFGDQSWTAVGQSKMQQREEKMHEAARRIQHAYRKHKEQNEEQPRGAIFKYTP